MKLLNLQLHKKTPQKVQVQPLHVQSQWIYQRGVGICSIVLYSINHFRSLSSPITSAASLSATTEASLSASSLKALVAKQQLLKHKPTNRQGLKYLKYLTSVKQKRFMFEGLLSHSGNNRHTSAFWNQDPSTHTHACGAEAHACPTLPPSSPLA